MPAAGPKTTPKEVRSTATVLLLAPVRFVCRNWRAGQPPCLLVHLCPPATAFTCSLSLSQKPVSPWWLTQASFHMHFLSPVAFVPRAGVRLGIPQSRTRARRAPLPVTRYWLSMYPFCRNDLYRPNGCEDQIVSSQERKGKKKEQRINQCSPFPTALLWGAQSHCFITHHIFATVIRRSTAKFSAHTRGWRGEGGGQVAEGGVLVVVRLREYVGFSLHSLFCCAAPGRWNWQRVLFLHTVVIT